jgi:hypothetical protein
MTESKRIAAAVEYLMDAITERDLSQYMGFRDDGSLYAVDFEELARLIPRGSADALLLRCAKQLWYARQFYVDPELFYDMLCEAPRTLFKRWTAALWIASGYITREMVEAMTVVELAAGAGPAS